MASQTFNDSQVSNPVTLLNAREPISLSAKFVYNFYLKDEQTTLHTSPTSPIKNESGFISQKTYEQIEEVERGSIRNRVARYIKLSIEPALPSKKVASGETITLPTGDTYVGGPAGTLKNYTGYPDSPNELLSTQIVNYEGGLTSNYASTTTAGDTNAVSRNFSLGQRISAAFLSKGSLTGETSTEDIIDVISAITSDEISSEEIRTLVGGASESYINYVNNISAASESPLDRKTAARTAIKVNNHTYQTDIVGCSIANPFFQNSFSDLFAGRNSLPDWAPSQGISLNPLNKAPRAPADATFESLIPQVNTLNAVQSTTTWQYISQQDQAKRTAAKCYLVGYIIDRLDSSTGEKRSIIILEPDQVDFYDTAILYGRSYVYSVRQLHLITGETIANIQASPNPHLRQAYAYLVASAPGGTITVPAKEKTPPEPVSILFCKFIYREGNGVELTWQSPNNPSRDIKKYQVFKRSSITEPFKLIAEYDFTDEEYESNVLYENVSDSLIIKSNKPVYRHIDNNFNRNSSEIYAVCAIDARGLSSTMGTQLKCTFDPFTNKMNVTKVSKPGAPKAYPNLFLVKNVEEGVSTTFLEDVAKDSNHGRMRIYFNPTAYAYLDITDSNKSAVAFKQGGSAGNLTGEYKFQIINLDRQKTKVLTIQIDGSKISNVEQT